MASALDGKKLRNKKLSVQTTLKKAPLSRARNLDLDTLRHHAKIIELFSSSGEEVLAKVSSTAEGETP